MRYVIKYLTVQRREIDVGTIDEAERYAKAMIGRLGDDALLVAIYAGAEPPKPADPPVGKPPSGPSPGTPVIYRSTITKAFGAAA